MAQRKQHLLLVGSHSLSFFIHCLFCPPQSTLSRKNINLIMPVSLDADTGPVIDDIDSWSYPPSPKTNPGTPAKVHKRRKKSKQGKTKKDKIEGQELNRMTEKGRTAWAESRLLFPAGGTVQLRQPGHSTREGALCLLPVQVILTWQGRHHDHERGSPRARLGHCTPAVLTLANSPNVGISTA